MTSDQRTSHAIIIQLRLVFLLLASSRSAPHVAILILHLIGLFMLPDISLMSFHSLQFDPETLRLLISLKSVRFNSAPFETPTESSQQPIPRVQLFFRHGSLSLSGVLSFFFVHSASVFPFPVTSSVCFPHPPPHFFFFAPPRERWKALPKQQSVRAIGYILPSAVRLN